MYHHALVLSTFTIVTFAVSALTTLPPAPLEFSQQITLVEPPEVVEQP